MGQQQVSHCKLSLAPCQSHFHTNAAGEDYNQVFVVLDFTQEKRSISSFVEISAGATEDEDFFLVLGIPAVGKRDGTPTTDIDFRHGETTIQIRGK